MNEPLLRTLNDVAGFLRGESIEFALIGGLAATVRGEPRATLDVDLIIGCDVDRSLQLVRSLDESSFRPLFDGIEEIVRTGFLIPLRHRETSIKMDLALGMTGFEQNAIRRATSVDIAGKAIPVVTAEDLVIMKILAGRPRDTDDVVGIMLRQGDTLDWDYVLKLAQELGESIGQDLVSELQRLKGESDASTIE